MKLQYTAQVCTLLQHLEFNLVELIRDKQDKADRWMRQ